MRALIVDDDVAIAKALTRMVAAPDVSVVTETDGPRALARLRVEVFDLVITDRQLPEIDGITICEAALSAGCRHVVLISGELEPPPADSRIQFLHKPFERSAVKEIVERARKQG